VEYLKHVVSFIYTGVITVEPFERRFMYFACAPGVFFPSIILPPYVGEEGRASYIHHVLVPIDRVVELSWVLGT